MSHIDTSVIQNSDMRNVPCPPGSRQNAGVDGRRRMGIGLFTTLFGAILLGGAQGTLALPTGFGTGCSVNGSTSAQSGDPNSLSYNSASFSTGCGGDVSSIGQVVVPVQTDGGLSLFNFDQTAKASASAGAVMGSLGALAKSESTSTPASYLYTTGGNGGITENEYFAGGNSSALAQWWDSMTVGGTANANGFVVLEFSLDLHGQTSASAIGASASFLSRLYINDGNRFISDQILGLSTPGTVSTTIGFRPGQNVQLYGDLNAITQSSAGRVGGGYVSASNAAADAANTAGFHIDVLTPGGSYSTLSGQTYITAVPEPATAWLLACGLLGSFGFMRRRWRLRVEPAQRCGR